SNRVQVGIQTIGWMPWRLRHRRAENNKILFEGSRSLSESWAKHINERLPQPGCFRLSTVLSSRCKVCSTRSPRAPGGSARHSSPSSSELTESFSALPHLVGSVRRV